MFRQQTIEQAYPGHGQAVEAGAIVRAVRKVADAVAEVFRPIVEAIGGPFYIEQLVPAVRAGMSEQQKGEADAYFNGVR